MKFQYSVKGYNISQMHGFVTEGDTGPTVLSVYEMELQDPTRCAPFEEIESLANAIRDEYAGFTYMVHEHCLGVRLGLNKNGNCDLICDALTITNGMLSLCHYLQYACSSFCI